MTAPWKLILVIAAMLLELAAAVPWPMAEPWPWRERLIGAGLFCYFLSLIVG